MNSIYDILNKLNNIQSAVDIPATEPVKQKSKLQESIDTVNEKYMGFKKVAAAAKAGGAKDPDAVAAAIGREKYGKEKFQKAAATGKKLGEEQTTYNKDEIIQMLTGRKTQAQVDTDRNRAAQTTTPPTDANAQTNEGIEKLSIGQQMARDGITYSVEREKELIGIIGDYLAKNGHSEKAIRYYLSYDEDFVPDQLSDLPKEAVVKEVAPPGAKAERMIKHIKKGYAKDGKLTDKEKSIAYATAWKAHKAGKVEEAVASLKPLLDAGMTAEQISEGWEDMMKAVKKQHKDQVGTGKFDKKKVSTGTVYTRKYDADGMSNTDDEVKADGEKRGRGRPKKSAFESSIDRLTAEVYGDLVAEGSPYAYRPSGSDIAGPGKNTLGSQLKGLGRDLINKIAPDDETLLKDLEKKTIGEEEGEELSYEQDQLRQAIGDDMFAQVKSAVEQGMSLASTEMPDAIYDALYDYYTESGEMPYGTAKARDGDPAEWIETRVGEMFNNIEEGEEMNNDLAEMMKLAGMQVKIDELSPDTLKSYQDKAYPQAIDASNPKAGQRAAGMVRSMYREEDDVEEGNEFSGALAKAKAAGAKEFEVDGKKYQVKEDEEQIEECGPMPMAMPMGELTISGSPEALAAMLKLAGLQAPAMMEQPVEEEKDPRYEANTTPEEEVMPVQVQIKGGNGEVAGMEKAMHKDGAARFSDNPLAMKESIDDMSEMGRDLMKAYESIKIQK